MVALGMEAFSISRSGDGRSGVGSAADRSSPGIIKDVLLLQVLGQGFCHSGVIGAHHGDHSHGLIFQGITASVVG